MLSQLLFKNYRNSSILRSQNQLIKILRNLRTDATIAIDRQKTRSCNSFDYKLGWSLAALCEFKHPTWPTLYIIELIYDCLILKRYSIVDDHIFTYLFVVMQKLNECGTGKERNFIPHGASIKSVCLFPLIYRN